MRTTFWIGFRSIAPMLAGPEVSGHWPIGSDRVSAGMMFAVRLLWNVRVAMEYGRPLGEPRHPMIKKRRAVASAHVIPAKLTVDLK
jgi:hypothetical protein